MKLNRVLLVYKPRMGGVLQSAIPPRWIGIRQRQHEASIEAVKGALESAGIAYDVISRDDLRPCLKADLLIAIGGDGTALAAAHLADDTPLIGVNSMPGHSVGFFCAATAVTVGRIIRETASGRRSPINLPLIEATIDTEPIPILALNEILFAGVTPAETVRYKITAGGRSEMQCSSGVWIAAGPGSTAAIRSAGGKRLAIGSRRIQYVVRELYPVQGRHYRLVRSILKEGASITIKAEMSDATIYIDGPKVNYSVPMGSKLTARVSQKSLKIFL